MNTTRKRIASHLLSVFCFSMLLSCGFNTHKTSHRFDYIAEPLALPQPQIQYLDILPGAAELPDKAKERIRLRRAFFTRDFEPLDKALNDAHIHFVEGKEVINLADDLAEDIKETGLAGLDACSAWLNVMPKSYAANRMCGEMWQQGAWMARSHYYISHVTPARFAIMNERLARSNALLEKAISLSPKPVEAMTLLAQNYFMTGAGQAGTKLLQQAQTLMPAYAPLHETRIVYSLPEWDGSEELVKKAMTEARSAGIAEEQLLTFHDSFVVRPSKTMSVPGAERAYWEKAINSHATRFRLVSLADHLLSLQNLRDTLLVTTRLVDEYPDYARGYSLRAYANQQLGNIPEAMRDYLMAVALGNDYATDILIRANLNGGLGLPVKNFEMLDQICRYGVALGTPSAIYGTATTLWEGDTVGKPFYTDIPQSLAWHLVAARTGLPNAQYDMGWLLISGQVPKMDQMQAQNNGVFWLRRAAEQGQQFAKKKLEEGGHEESEVIDIRKEFWPGLYTNNRISQKQR